jgi:predicted DNA-binding transcriptional regulator AlpA
MATENSLKSVCSITAMAKKLILSRSRFYDLLNQGVFPKPVNCPGSNHLFYTLELQQQCLQVKQTGIGINGKPVLFYSPRKHKAGKNKCAEDTNPDYFAMRLLGLLKNMGATLKISQLRAILKRMYPDGFPEWPIDQTELRKIFNHAGGENRNDV